MVGSHLLACLPVLCLLGHPLRLALPGRGSLARIVAGSGRRSGWPGGGAEQRRKAREGMLRLIVRECLRCACRHDSRVSVESVPGMRGRRWFDRLMLASLLVVGGFWLLLLSP